MQCGTRGWIPEQKKDISGKAGEIQIKTRLQLTGMYDVSFQF